MLLGGLIIPATLMPCLSVVAADHLLSRGACLISAARASPPHLPVVCGAKALVRIYRSPLECHPTHVQVRTLKTNDERAASGGGAL